MKFKKFKEQFDGAPLDEVSLAEEASKITDNLELSSAAKAYLKAYDKFKQALENNDIIIG